MEVRRRVRGPMGMAADRGGQIHEVAIVENSSWLAAVQRPRRARPRGGGYSFVPCRCRGGHHHAPRTGHGTALAKPLSVSNPAEVDDARPDPAHKVMPAHQVKSVVRRGHQRAPRAAARLRRVGVPRGYRTGATSHLVPCPRCRPGCGWDEKRVGSPATLPPRSRRAGRSRMASRGTRGAAERSGRRALAILGSGRRGRWT
jgi:hypothetical protein